MIGPQPPARATSRPQAADLRLLGPALVAWAVAAITLPWTVGARALLGAAALGGALLVGVLATAGRRRRRGTGRRDAVLAVLALVLAAVGLSTVASAGHAQVRETGPVRALAERGARVSGEGVVLQEPRRLAPGPNGAERVVLRVRLDQVSARGTGTPVVTPVLVLASGDWADLTWRQPVTVRGRLGPADPGEDVVAVLYAEGPPAATGEVGPSLRALEGARARLRTTVDPLPPDPRGLLPALVIGDTSLTPPDLTDAMLATGMSHLSAVSGSNITIVLGGVLLLASGVGLGRRARVPVALVALIGFVLLCRPEPSVLRAAVMGAVGLLAVLAARRGAALSALGTAVLVLLVVDPWLARAPGFALSTLATLGLVLLARPWGEALARHLPRWARPLGYAVAIPVAAQLMVGPVVVVLQENVAPISVLTNLLAAPLVAPSTLLGVAATLLGLVHPAVGGVAAWLGAVPTAGIAAIARWGVTAPLPWATVAWPGGLRGALLLAGVSLVLLLLGPWVLWRARRAPVVAALVVLVIGVLAYPTGRAGWLPSDWRVVACDVGQGDALVLASGPGRGVLIDTGPDPPALRTCLDDLGIEALDAVVLSHDHRDHAAGLALALGELPVGEVVVPARSDGQPLVGVDTATLLRTAGVPVRPARAGDTLAWGRVAARVLGPGPVRVFDPDGANDASLVLEARVGAVEGDIGRGATTVLLTGDVEAPGQRALLRALRAAGTPSGGTPYDVLKIAHHGSSGRDPAFLDRVRGRVAVVSVGADNPYGHPAPDVVADVRGAGTVLLRTDLHGAVAVGGSAGGLWVAQEAG